MLDLLRHPFQSLPEFGTVVLYAILVAAAYTFAVAVAAGAGRPRLLQAARLGAYGTVSLVALAVLVLAYAFVSHDFRIEYVSHYSERAMSPWFQLRRRIGIGVFVPPSAAEPWISEHPALVRTLEAMDRVASRALAPLGDHVLYWFERTSTPAGRASTPAPR